MNYLDATQALEVVANKLVETLANTRWEEARM
jgi:hypothetical protein